ncbi:MAG: DUF4838 domain-containing protein [Lentisphaeria bacterium]|nr:DUF4838 domain-containing protein [Lentisphaeria bacterium]
MKKILLLVLLGLSAAVLAAVPETVTLVKNNKVQFQVVIPDKPDWPTKLAAEDIVNVVREAYKSRANIISESKLASTKGNLINIHMGWSKYTQQFEKEMPNPYGFLVKFVDDKNIVIGGRLLVKDNYNTLDGATYFLEKFLGMRIIMPGDLGTVIPAGGKDLVIPAKSFTRVADFPGRSYSGSHGPFYKGEKLQKTINWTRRVGMTVSNVLKMVHNVGNLIDPEIYAKSNPEFFPLIDGKRRFPKKIKDPHWKLMYWEPCYTAPGIAEAAAKSVIEFFKKNPNLYNCSLSVNDNGNICQCDNCVKKNAHLPKGSESQSYYEWVNKVVSIVKKEYPDRYFGVLNYWVTKDMPKNVKLDPAVVPMVCEDFKFYVDPIYRARLEKRLQKWDETASTLGWWDYGFEGSYLVPTYNPKFNAAFLKELYHKHNLRYYFCEWGPGPAWKNTPEIYMMSKLLWDIDQDADKLIDEWFELAVGKEAAVPFKKYYDVWARFWNDDVTKTPWFRNRGDKEIPFLQRRDCYYLDALTYEMIDEALKYIDETVKLAPEGREKMRAEFFRDWFVNAYDKYYLPYLNSKALARVGKDAQGKVLYNYTFDKGVEKWVPWHHSGMTPKMYWDKSVGRNGKGSLKCDRSDSLPTGMVWYRRPLDFKLQAGKNYRFTVWVRAEKLGKNDSASMVLFFPNGKNSVIGKEYSTSAGSLSFEHVLKYDNLKDGKWKKLETYVAVPQSAWQGDVKGVNCQLSGHTEQTGTVFWFDDYTIEEISGKQFDALRKAELKRPKKVKKSGNITDPVTGEVLGPELVIDGDMELTETNGIWHNNHTPKVAEKSTKFARSGKRSMHIVSDSNGDGVLQIVKPVEWDGLFKVSKKGLVFGKTYKVEVWVKNMDPSQYEELRFYGTSLKAKLITKDSEWTKFTFYTKFDIKKITPYICIGYGSTKCNSFFDDLSIREVIKPAAK